MQARNLVFTLNNYCESEYETLSATDNTYLIIGKEGKEKTEHLQGYIEFGSSKRLTTLKKINPRIHWEKRKGTAAQARDYCKKEGDWKEWGTISSQGKRSDIDDVREKLKAGAGMRQIVEEGTSFMSMKVAQLYLNFREEKRDWKPKVTWIWGASGAGKSTLAYELLGGKKEEIFMKDDTKWWENYDKHEKVMIDDFRAHSMRLTYLLKVLDKFPMTIEVKGGSRQLLAKEIIITSIVHPEQIYQMADEPMVQLMRRIDNVIHKKTDCDVMSM